METASYADQVSLTVGVVFATGSGFRPHRLRDDRGFFTSYMLTPVIRKPTLERAPDIKPLLEKLSAQLDNATMAALNGAVDLQGRRVEDVAEDFLRSRALLNGR
jgi:osmoprotectant transport system substrate-binding protein